MTSFTWLPERGRDNHGHNDIFHVLADGVEHVVYFSDEAKQDFEDDGRDAEAECKAIAERKISRDPVTRDVLVTTADR